MNLKTIANERYINYFSSSVQKNMNDDVCHRFLEDMSNVTEKTIFPMPPSEVTKAIYNRLSLNGMVASYIFQYFVSNKEEIINIATSILKDHILDEEETVDNTDYINSLNEEIGKLNKKFDTLIELRTDGAISKEIFMTKAAGIEKRQKEIKTKLQELEPKEKTSNAIDYEQKIQLFTQVLNEYTKVDFDKKIPPNVLEAFIKAVVVYPDSLEFHMRIGDTEEYNNIGTSVKVLEFMVDKTFALKFIAGRKDVHHIKLTRWHDMKCSIHI